MSRASLLFLTVSGVLVAAAVALGLWVTPSPSTQRMINLDSQRVDDLIALADAVLAYRRTNGRLPASLRGPPEAASLRLADRVTNAAYGYIVNDPRTFQLCAEFAAISDKAVKSSPPEASGWKHQAGRHCFTFPAPAGVTTGQGQD
jgi:hypothetical protein